MLVTILQLWTLVGIYLAIAVAAVLIVAVFVDPLPKDLVEKDEQGISVGQQSLRYMVATVKHLRHREQLLLIPVTIYSGLEQALYGAEFSKVLGLHTTQYRETIAVCVSWCYFVGLCLE